jgi:hypothetical protein
VLRGEIHESRQRHVAKLRSASQRDLILAIKVRAPAIERLLRRGCFPPNLWPAAVTTEISHLRFPYTTITVPAALCHPIISGRQYGDAREIDGITSKPGEIFDGTRLDDFFKVNRAILPSDASKDDVNIKRDLKRER